MTDEDPYLGSQLIPKITRAIQEQGVRAFKCFAEKPELQFASPENTNRARKVISEFKNI
jgi:hypothetical protein